MKIKIINLLSLYNIHIGHNYSYNTSLNSYVLGQRFSFSIIDIPKVFYFFKRALVFISNMSLHNCSMLFYHTNFDNIDFWYKCLFVNMVNKHSQSMVTHNWIYGSISNYFFTFYHLIKEIHDLWLNNLYQTTELKASKRRPLGYYYYNSDDEDSFLSYFRYKFLKNMDQFNKKYKKKDRNIVKKRRFTLYRFWLKKQKQYGIWSMKQISKYYFNFLKKLFFNDVYNVFKQRRHFNFKSLFLKLFYFLQLKKKDYFFLDYKFEINKKDIFINRKFMLYWRLILYFKYFHNVYQLPEVFFCVFPDTNYKPLREYCNAGLNAIGVVDTNNNIGFLNYPIISNDDSLVIILFYYSMISNILSKNRLYLFHYLQNKSDYTYN